MKKALLAAVLLLHAATAGALDHNVTNDATMTVANAAVSAGDRVLIANGTYTVAINPAVSGGSSTRITYIGNIASPGSVVVPGLSVTKNYITVKGVASTGGLSISSAASNDSIIYCTGAAGAPTIGWGTLNVIAYCTTTTTGNVYGFDCQDTSVPENGTLGSHNYIGYCDITAADYSYRGHNYFMFEHNRLTLTIPNGAATDQHFGTMYVCRGFIHRDNHITGINNSGEERRLLVMRDSTILGNLVRDTLIASTSGNKKISGIWTSSGAYNRVERVRIDSCFVKCGREAVVFQQDSKWMTIKNSVLISDSARVVQLDGAAYDSLTFEHNTCANLTAPADRGVFMQDGTAATNRRVKHNIFYSPSNSTASNGTGIGTFHGPVPASGNKQEYNLFFSRSGAGSTAAVKYQFTYSAVGTGTAWNGQASAPDSFSVWGSPVFTDSSWATFNPALGSGSFANSGSWPDGYVGAINPAGADVTPPDAVSDLAVDGAGSFDLDLAWTAPGDDASTGTATSYDLRYSTSTINEGNWASATQATGEPTPQVAGSSEEYRLEGLTPGVTYYVALKTTDEANNTSSLSNVASASTTADNGGPASISDLTVIAQTTTTITMVWEAPEDPVWGTVSSYDLRRSTSTITEGNWASATQLTGEPTPQAPAFEETYVATGLTPATTYYFAVKSTDGSGNVSDISNVASGTTDGDPLVALSIVTKDDVAGLVFDYAADADTNATVRVFYGVGAATDTAHAPARRPGSARTYATSLFGLAPATTYTVNITTSDGAAKETTFTTRPYQWWKRTQTGPSVYVSPGGNDANSGLTTLLPKRTISAAWTTLKAQPGAGRGGAVVFMDGTYYQRQDFSGSLGVPDTGYFLKALNPGSAIIDGADERIVNGTATLSWEAVDAANDPERIGVGSALGDTLFRAAYAATDSLDGVWINGLALHRATSFAEIWNKAGSSSGGGYNLLHVLAAGHYYIGTAGDSLYLRVPAGVQIRTATIHFGYRASLFYVDDPYVQIEGLTFRHAGGLPLSNGMGVRFNGGGGANNGTVYNCTLEDNSRWGVYGLSTGGVGADSITIANCTYDGGGVERFGYAAGKGRREESGSGSILDGTYLTIIDNTARRAFNGWGISGISGNASSGANGDISRNTITDVADDAIEYEEGSAVNGRVLNNSATRFLHGISMTPLQLGPTFYIGNLLRYPQSTGAGFKLGGGTTGQAFIYHNTVAIDTTVTSSGTTTVGGQVWHKTFRNNVLTGTNGLWQPIRNTLSSSPDSIGTITNTFNYNLTWPARNDTTARWKADYYTKSNVTSLLRFEADGVKTLHPGWRDTANGDWGATRGIDLGQRIAGITGALRVTSGTAPDIGAVETDGIRPGPPTLTFAGRGLVSATVRWTAVGDDSLTDTANYYDLRISTSAINSGNFASATQLSGEPTPGVPGTVESYTATGLTRGTTYYFGLLVYDEVGNPSALATTSGATKAAGAVRFLWWNPWTWIRSFFP